MNMDINQLLCTLRCNTIELTEDGITTLVSSEYTRETLLSDIKVLNEFRPSKFSTYLNETSEECKKRLASLIIRLLKKASADTKLIRLLLVRWADLCNYDTIFRSALAKQLVGHEHKFLPSMIEFCNSCKDPVMNLLLSMALSELSIECNSVNSTPMLLIHCTYLMLVSQREVFADAHEFYQNLQNNDVNLSSSSSRTNDITALDFTACHLRCISRFLRNSVLAAVFISGISIINTDIEKKIDTECTEKINNLLFSGDIGSINIYTSGFPVHIELFAPLLSSVYSHKSYNQEIINEEMKSLISATDIFYNGISSSLTTNTECLKTFCDAICNLCSVAAPEINNAVQSTSSSSLHVPILYTALLNAWLVAEIIITTNSIGKQVSKEKTKEEEINEDLESETDKKDDSESITKEKEKSISTVSLNNYTKNEFLKSGLITLVTKILRSPSASRKNKIIRIACKFLTAMCSFPESVPAMLTGGLTSTIAKYDSLAPGKDLNQESTSEIVHQTIAIKNLNDVLSKSINNVTDFESYVAELQSDVLDMTPLRSISLSQISTDPGAGPASPTQNSQGGNISSITGTLAAAAEGFWKSNATKFIENDCALLKRLVEIGKQALDKGDAVTACAALHDLGAFSSSHPNGREIINNVEGAKQLAAMAMQVRIKDRSSQQMLREMSVMALSKMVVGEWNKVFESAARGGPSKSINSSGNMFF